jgi:Ca2+-transporting ATPase
MNAGEGRSATAVGGKTEPWHALAPEAALAHLESTEGGLAESEARRRRATHGANVIEGDSGPKAWRVLLRQLRSPIVFLLFAASGVAFALGKSTDAAIVLASIAVNVVIGFLQEYRAGKAVAALSRMVPQQATVLRDGGLVSIPAAEVVPGDVLHISSGDRVAADARVLAARGLRVDEAALTGESMPSDKRPEPVSGDVPLGDRSSMVYGGTLVAAGTAKAVVTSTGGQTELGRISALLESTTELETPLTQALARVGKWLSLVILVLSVLLFGAAVLRGYSPADGLLVAVALAVASIPEGLPAIVTVTLAIAVQRMARRRAIVRRLPSVETLGSTTVICSDKTGTLTRNEMTAQAVVVADGTYELTGVGYAPHGELIGPGGSTPATETTLALFQAGVLCNDARRVEENGAFSIAGDPTEGALVVAATKVGLDVDLERAAWRRIDAIPFESERQYMASLHAHGDGRRLICVKGAPEVVLGKCAVDEAERADALAKVHDLAKRGLRVLAIASAEAPSSLEALDERHVAGDLRFLGLVGLIDPPRPEAIAAVSRCKTAGIAVKMITGDHAGTAHAIGAQLGLAGDTGRAVTGVELAKASDAELDVLVRSNNVFARVAPEHKLRLVGALQRQGHVVAMTGDGVNDAPAIKQANIGVAMGITGSAVSKEAAHVVLADDNFATIAAAVEEGRRVYDNLVKSMVFVLPTNIAMGLLLIVAVLAFPLVPSETGALLPLMPASPSQLLWVNLVTSVALSLPLAFEVPEPGLMARSPRVAGARMIDGRLLARMIFAAAVMCASALGVFWWEYHREAARVGHVIALREAQTMAVTAVVFAQIGYLFTCRNLRGGGMGVLTNPSVFAGVGLLLVLHAAFIFAPPINRVLGTASLDVVALAMAAAAGLAILPIVALEKLIRARLAEVAPISSRPRMESSP